MNKSRLFYHCTIGSLLAILLVMGFSACKKYNDANLTATVFSAAHVSAGRPAAGLDSYRIAYYEAVPGGEFSGGTIQESDEPFKIVDFGPFEELPAEIKKPSIYVVFSQPVVPLARLGEPLKEDSAFFTIEPALKGTYRWYGTRLLSFEPDNEYIPQQQYKVTVSDKIKSLGGKNLEGMRYFSFETERLRALTWHVGTGEYWVSTYNADPNDAKNIGLIFSHPVNLNEISKWISVNAEGKDFAFTVSRLSKIDERRYNREQGVLLTLTETLPHDSDVKVTIRKGARSEDGWLGAKEDKAYTFHTLRPFKFERVSVRSAARPRTEEGDSIPISLHFSQNVDPANGASLFSVVGMPALKKENVHFYGSTVVINRLPLEYETSYQVRISRNVKDVWGRSLARDETVQADVGAANSYVYFLNSGSRMLEAGFLPYIAWEAQNPVSLRSNIIQAQGPYERLATSSLEVQDLSKLPKNSKRFFMEDLSPFLGPSGKGSAAMAWEYETRSDWERGRIYKSNTWLTVQVTDIGITLRYAYNTVLVWATRLSTGEAIADAAVELREGSTVIRDGKTDSQGLAIFRFSDGEFASRFTDLTPSNSTQNWDKGFRVRVIEAGGAAAGGDEAEFMPNGSHNIWRFRVQANATPFTVERERPLIFLFTDRGLYKPGETVTFRGIDRNLSRGVFQAYEGDYSIEVSTGAYDAPVIASLKGKATKNGGSHGSFTLPDKLDPGRYVIRYKRTETLPAGAAARSQTEERNREQTITFTVANFERLRFEAKLSFPDLLHYKGDKISGRLSASYLSGGGLAGAPYTYYWSREPASFNPGGSWRYWRFGPDTYDGRYFVAQGEGNLGADGSDDVSHNVGTDGVEGAAYRYRLEASVQDAARQEITAMGALVVHPASFYIGSRLDAGTKRSADLDFSSPSAWFLQANSPATVSWALIDPEGNGINQRSDNNTEAPEISLVLIHYEWKQSRQAGIGGRINLNWERVENIVMNREFKPGRGEYAGVIPFTPSGSGQWEVRLNAKDSRGRSVSTRYGFYVSGAGWVQWGGDADSITLTPDKPSYAPGETAKLLVQSPLPKGKYLLTIEREGILNEKIIELDGSARTIDIPIEESYVPIVYAAIASYTVRSAPPENSYYEPDLGKPKGLFGLATIFVDEESRHYTIEIESSKGSYRPAEEAEVTLKVSLNNKPAAGVELTFMAVDRGVLDLINYHVPDPLAFFYNPRNFPLGVRGADSRSILIDPVTYSLTDLQGGDEEDNSKLDERKDFRPTAIFEPYLVTGSDGTVKVKFSLPDSLTTYRCTAVAVGLNDFGISEQDLRVSAPLTALAAMPRKLRWRDTGTISLILTNLEKDEVEARVSVETETIEGGNWDTVLEIDGEKEKTVKIQSGASAEVSFMAAALGAGESRITFTLRSPLVNERIVRTLKVDRPVLYETVSTIGSLGSDNPFFEEGVALPSLVPEGTGSLSVSLSASRLALLKEAVRYLFDYPYGCIEQRTARLLPIVAFADRLETFELGTPITNPKKLIEDELAELAKSQLSNGAFPYWPGGRTGSEYVSLRVAHIAALAKEKGYAIPAAMNTQRLLQYISGLNYSSAFFNRDPFLKGYSLWVRAMYGERIGTDISNYLKNEDGLGISGWGLAGLAAMELGMKDLASSARDRVRRYIRPGTRTLDLTDTYQRQGNFWGYDADRYAIALMLYHSLNPSDDMTTRLANSLIERQRRGVWGNTSSSYWAILAFDRIASAEEKEREGSEELISSLSLGGAPLMDAAFQSLGAAPAFKTWTFDEVPLFELQRDTILPLRIEREGAGRLYYTASLRYGIPTELASPRDEGLSVFAETFDSSGNLVKDSVLIPGKTYTRKVTISSARDRTFVALRAPIPSGAEIVDAVFVTSSTVPPKETSEENDDYSWWYWEAPPVRFVMDDEVQFNWDFFPSGKKEVEFRFRAVMPGIYPTPPVQAECMYEEEIFGRGAGELYRIGKLQ